MNANMNTTLGHSLATELQPIIQAMYHHLAGIGLVITDGNACYPCWTNADVAVFTARHPAIVNIDLDTKYETIYNSLARARTAIAVTQLAVRHEPEKLTANELKSVKDDLAAAKARADEIEAILDVDVA